MKLFHVTPTQHMTAWVGEDTARNRMVCTCIQMEVHNEMEGVLVEVVLSKMMWVVGNVVS